MKERIQCLFLALMVMAFRFSVPAAGEQATSDETPLLYFRVLSDGGSQTILPMSRGSALYAFLPSCANASNTVFVVDSERVSALDGASLPGDSALDIDNLLQQDSHTLTIDAEGGLSEYSLQICRSANIASMYIDTASGSMDKIHADKDYRETVRVVLLDRDGRLCCQDSDVVLKGRGNSTWWTEKKPYLLKLSQSQTLLDMNSAEKWVLLANAFDTSNLRTKLVFDFAKKLGFEATPQCDYLDLYLNGRYAGMYTLCEKVEDVYKNARGSHSDADYLCRIDSRAGAFMTETGQLFLIESPEDADEQEANRISGMVQQLERMLFDETADWTRSDFIDLESWVQRYLIDEIFENIDTGRLSYYFYCVGNDGDPTFCAGPIWDYDLCWGADYRTSNPACFVACEARRSADAAQNWNNRMYQNAAFLEKVRELYQTMARPLLNELIDTGIDAQFELTREAQRCNAVLWDAAMVDPEILKTYMRERMAFLDRAWLDGVEFRMVQAEYAPGGEYVNYSVASGELFPGLPDHDASIGIPAWVERDTGETFDFSKPILRDTILSIRDEAP